MREGRDDGSSFNICLGFWTSDRCVLIIQVVFLNITWGERKEERVEREDVVVSVRRVQ